MTTSKIEITQFILEKNPHQLNLIDASIKLGSMIFLQLFRPLSAIDIKNITALNLLFIDNSKATNFQQLIPVAKEQPFNQFIMKISPKKNDKTKFKMSFFSYSGKDMLKNIITDSQFMANIRNMIEPFDNHFCDYLYHLLQDLNTSREKLLEYASKNLLIEKNMSAHKKYWERLTLENRVPKDEINVFYQGLTTTLQSIEDFKNSIENATSGPCRIDKHSPEETIFTLHLKRIKKEMITAKSNINHMLSLLNDDYLLRDLLVLLDDYQEKILYLYSNNEKLALQKEFTKLKLLFSRRVNNEDNYIYLFFLREYSAEFFHCLLMIAEKKILYPDHIKKINDELRFLSFEQITKKLKVWENIIQRLLATELLTSETLTIIIKQNLLDRTCVARVDKGQGLELVAHQSKQQIWNYYSAAIELAMIKLLDNEASLKDILNYSRHKRKIVAIDQKLEYGKNVSHNGGEFGIIRTTPSSDTFNDGSIEHRTLSVTSPAIFNSLRELAQTFFLTYQDKFTSTTDVEFTARYEIKIPVCTLPELTITLKIKKNATIASIYLSFKPFTEVDYFKAIDNINEYYFIRLKEKAKTNQIKGFLFNLGSLIFCLGRLYLQKRGSGATIQLMIRSTIKKYLDIEVGNINLGKNLDIPCEIYVYLEPSLYKFSSHFMDHFLLLPEIQKKVHADETLEPKLVKEELLFLSTISKNSLPVKNDDTLVNPNNTLSGCRLI